MKQTLRFLTAAVLLLISVAASAQTSTDDWSFNTYKYMGKYPGYVVTNNGDTLKGYVQLRNQTENQEKCWFYANETDKKPQMKYAGDDLKCYAVADKFYTAALYGNLFGKKKSFVMVMTTGRIHNLKWYWIDEQVYPHVLKTDDIMQKGDDKPVNPGKFIFFAKNMSEYISDDAELSAKVKNKEKGYGFLEMTNVINEYNAWWEANHKK
jgi:hypothetical protein